MASTNTFDLHFHLQFKENILGLSLFKVSIPALSHPAPTHLNNYRQSLKRKYSVVLGFCILVGFFLGGGSAERDKSYKKINKKELLNYPCHIIPIIIKRYLEYTLGFFCLFYFYWKVASESHCQYLIAIIKHLLNNINY